MCAKQFIKMKIHKKRNLLHCAKVAVVITAFVQASSAQVTESPNPQSVNTVGANSVYGEYRYIPQTGAYRGTTIGESMEDFGESFTRFGRSVTELNEYAGWSATNSDGNFSYAFGANLRPMLGGNISGNFGNPYFGVNPNSLALSLGPIIFDQFTLGYGALFTDGSGQVPGVTNDDGWAQIVWLNTRASVVLGNSISISIQPMIYWLPEEGEVGWGLPAPIAGVFLSQQFSPASLAQIAWSKQVGPWQLSLFDQFSPYISPYSFWDTAFSANSPGWYDLSPIDRVGRYSLGYGSQDPGNFSYNTESRIGARSDGYRPLYQFYNWAGARAYRDWSAQTQSMFYFDRMDIWDDDFNHSLATISGGGYVQTGNEMTRYWTGYSFASTEPFDDFLHNAVFGASHRFSGYLSGYVQAGYYWYSGNIQDHGYMGQIGINQQLGAYTYHNISAGRRMYHPGLQKPGIEDFMEYRFVQQLGSRSTLMLYSGISERHVETHGPENDVTYKFAGLNLSSQLTARSFAFATVGWESAEYEIDGWETDRWLYRFGLLSQFEHNVQMQCFYQYEDVHGTQNYSEHLLYLGMSKSF